MNERQRNALLLAVALLVVMVLFPPWLYYDGNTSNQAFGGYHSIFTPPSVTTYLQMFGLADDEIYTTRFVRVQLNGVRLTVQVLTVAFFTVGLMLSFRRRRLGSPSGFFIALGIMTACLLILLVWSQKY
ncbi:MAG TPA: hypothetical protein VFV34_26635 [Blastocatellia bacterium]|nr:hypothetical protein [Blastocatellia bacterium]